jgi:hypothetical protein
MVFRERKEMTPQKEWDLMEDPAMEPDDENSFEMVDLEIGSGGFEFPCSICKHKKSDVKYCKKCPGYRTDLSQKAVEDFILEAL